MFLRSYNFDFSPTVNDAQGRLFLGAALLIGGDAIVSPASLVRTRDGEGSDTLAEFMDPRTMGVPTEACNAGVSTFVAGTLDEGVSTSGVTAEALSPLFLRFFAMTALPRNMQVNTPSPGMDFAVLLFSRNQGGYTQRNSWFWKYLDNSCSIYASHGGCTLYAYRGKSARKIIRVGVSHLAGFTVHRKH